MIKNQDNSIFIFLVAILVLISNPLFGQNNSGFQYVNPLPNSSYVSINSKIIIRQGGLINYSSINDKLINVIGSKSGVHRGKTILANDKRTLVFTPFIPFQTDEEVTVKLNNGLLTSDGTSAGILNFTFHTCKNPDISIIDNVITSNQTENNKLGSSATIAADTILPSNLPRVVIDASNDPSPGYFFLSATPYLEIVDNEGTPVFYRKVAGSIYDFKLQPNGELTYFLYPVSCYGLNNSYNQVQTFTTADSFSVDVHDLRVLPDGSYYLFGKRNVTMDLSQYGGSPVADIIDGALQGFDSSGNLIFQWDALDHYKITDLDSNDANTNLINAVQDFPHFNSVDFDSDGNLLISARNLDEITKVDRNTGEIIWRWGGKNNQFTFINDSLGFSRQHDVRRFSNGNISLFDNGTFHSIKISSAVEYKLDEENKTATLVRRIYHNNIYTETEGSVQEMANGNRVISWGHNWDPMITEVKPNDSIAIDLSYQYFIDTYRAFKYEWETNLFATNIDSLNFGVVAVGDSLTKQFTVYNPNDSALTINEFFWNNPAFATNIKAPIIIQPKDSLIVPVTFKPEQHGKVNMSFNIRLFANNGSQQMIARQVILSGETDNVSAINSNVNNPDRFMLFQNYPNPFNPSTVIKYELPSESKVSVIVYNLLGQKMKEIVNETESQGYHVVTFDAGNLPSGIYFYRITAGQFSSVKKMLLIK